MNVGTTRNVTSRGWSLNKTPRPHTHIYETHAYICIYIYKGMEKLLSGELDDLNSSPNTVWVTKSRRMRWAVHVARMGRGESYTGFWWGNLREIDHLGDPRVDGRIKLR